MLWVTDAAEACTLLSGAWLEYTGQAESEALGFGWTQAIHPEDRGRAAEVFREANRRGEEFSRDYRLRRRDGEYRWVIDRGRPRHDSTGAFLGYVGSVIDVHERKQAEASLQENEQRLRLALEAGRMGTWAWEISTGRVEWSPALEALHGLAPGSFEGTFEAFLSDVHPDDRERVQSSIARTIESGEDHHVEYRIQPAGGGIRWVEGRGRVRRDAQGRSVGMVGVCADTTERNQAAESLRRSEQALTDFFDTASVGLHWVGPDGVILRANAAELELLGYSREEYVGKHIADFHVDRSVIEDILGRLAAGERVHEQPARMRCKDGSVREVLITSSGLFEDGRLVHTRCFTVDVTARKRAERGLLARARQQEAVAALGELALRERELQKVFEQATEAVAETLDVELCKVLEMLPGGAELLLCAPAWAGSGGWSAARA